MNNKEIQLAEARLRQSRERWRVCCEDQGKAFRAMVFWCGTSSIVIYFILGWWLIGVGFMLYAAYEIWRWYRKDIAMQQGIAAAEAHIASSKQANEMSTK